MWSSPDRDPDFDFGLVAAQLPTSVWSKPMDLSNRRARAIFVAHDRTGGARGEWYSRDICYFDLSLSGRPASARGCFDGMEGGYRPVGDLLFIPTGIRYHARGGPGRQTSLAVEVRTHQQFDDEAISRAILPVVLKDCMNLPFDRLRPLLSRIRDEATGGGFASDVILEGLGLALLGETLRLLSERAQFSGRRGGLSPYRLRLIDERVRDGDTLPTLTELAILCGLSRRQLMRAFRDETGQTIGEYLRSVVLERAKSLLRDGNLPIASIAAATGFTNAGAFSTAFRKKAGHSPLRFRQLNGRKPDAGDQ